MLRIIGDVHGKRSDYLTIVNDANAKGISTLQLGDLGFAYEYARLMDDTSFDVNKNKFFMGNHDCYEFRNHFKNPWVEKFNQFCLGDFGEVAHGGIKFFFVRGAFSIDNKYRTVGIDYFLQEELPFRMADEVVQAWMNSDTETIISHDCPYSIGRGDPLKGDRILVKFGFNPKTFCTSTQMILQKVIETKMPKNYFFGHYHQKWDKEVDGCKFMCLPELGYVDVHEQE